MIQVLEYIVQNYTSLLIVLILILLAIIGYYADKTNFGQGKNKDKEKEEKLNENKTINDVINKEELVEKIEEKSTHNLLGDKEKEEKKNENKIINDVINKEESAEKIDLLNIEDKQTESNKFQLEDKKQDLETKEIFDEIDSLLPKKELINSDLLSEIEGMELNSLKEKTSFDVPDLDDISLPKIKNLVEKEQDIWKF